MMRFDYPASFFLAIVRRVSGFGYGQYGLLLPVMALLLASAPALAATPCNVTTESTNQYRVMVIGDSWATLALPALNSEMAVTRGLEGVQATAHARLECTTAIPGSLARDWNSKWGRQRITAALAAYPEVSVVYLSLGANDLPLILAPHKNDALYMEWALAILAAPAADRAVWYQNIADDVIAVIQHILAQRPNLRVLVMGYDYFNLVADAGEFSPIPGAFQAIQPPATTNSWFWQQLTNWMLIDLERAKSKIVSIDPKRVVYLPTLGLLHFYGGYTFDEADYNLNDFQYPSGYAPSRNNIRILPGSAPLPWGDGYTFLPSPPHMMHDRHHLNEEGQRAHAQAAIHWYIKHVL